MTHSQSELDEAETRLQQAMLAGDVAALDGLIHDEAAFTGADGSIVPKAADLETHRSGALQISELTELSRQTQVVGGVGITRATTHLRGRAGGTDFEATLAYTRTWITTDAGWVVLAAHGGPGAG